jgi:hypothetical protein
MQLAWVCGDDGAYDGALWAAVAACELCVTVVFAPYSRVSCETPSTTAASLGQ